MGSYHIRDLESLSGIKAHTIRMWEHRYGLLRPSRTRTNIRRYSDKELKHLLNIALLQRRGYRISRLASMPASEIQQLVAQLVTHDFSSPAQIHALMQAMVDFDQRAFHRLLETIIAQLGFDAAMDNVVFPFLERIGVMWQTGSINVAQEHMISHLIRQKITVAIDRVMADIIPQDPKVVLFLPEEELHELSLLYAHYLLVRQQRKTLYLGQNVPLEDLREACQVFQPEYGICIITSKPSERRLQAYISELQEIFKGRILFVGGLRLMFSRSLKLPQNFKYFSSREQLKMFLSQLAT
ncbi:MAG: MerR family transcriptional regulator [Chitinophagales bacterium]|nr:MerR family transcriptional regulator [Chitinophagales bacterium]MDW8427654.1 MerR family transcriptional regulator [Chitinophagales bacterium]